MLAKSRAIALHYIKYGDTGIIHYAYTRQYGRLSLIIQGVRKAKARTSLNLFQPLQVNDIDFYHKEKQGLMRIKEAKCVHMADHLLLEPEKNAVALFLAEILYKTLKEEVKNENLYDFIEQRIQILNATYHHFAMFYLKFLIDYSLYLGFSPNTTDIEQAKYFDLKNGVFTNWQPNHDFFCTGEVLSLLKTLLDEDTRAVPEINISGKVRNQLLHVLLDYYMFHIEGFNVVKSVQVLEEIFRG